MQQKRQLSIFGFILILLFIFVKFSFFGCAGTQSGKELTPEQKKAIADSLKRVHQKELALLWSFGYEPYKQQDYKRAKGYFKKVAEKDTSGIYGKVLYQMLGTCYLQLGIPDSAEWAYKIGVKRLPDNPYFYKALRYIYRTAGRNEEGIEVSKSLAKLEPDSADHYRKMGEFYINLEQPEEATEVYKTAVQLDPNDKKSQEILDKLLTQTASIDDIIAQRESMVERFPDDINLRLDLSESYFKLGDFNKAIGHLKIVTLKEPENIQALELLGESYQQTQKFSDAVATYRQILKKNPKDKKNLCNLAMSYTSLGKYTTAMRQVQKALSIEPKYGLAYLTRGMIYEAAAEVCVSKNENKVTFDDKLVYKLAYDEYLKAKNDLEWKQDAENRMNYLQTLIPTKSDYFMHKNQKTPKSACYEWIL